MSGYTNSMGDVSDSMSFATALEIVHELAEQNQIDETDVAFGDAGLASQAEWQQKALDTLHDLVVNHEDDLDALATPGNATDWDVSIVHPDRNDDPEQPFAAVRIALSMAKDNALRPDQAAGSEELQDELSRQRQALDLASDLIALHGDELKRIVVIATSSRLDP